MSQSTNGNLTALKRLEKRKEKRDAVRSSTPSVVPMEVVDQLESLALATEKSKKHANQEEVFNDIVARKDVKKLSKKVASLSSLNSKLKKEVEETKTVAEKALKEVSDKLAKAEEENAQLRASLKSSEEKVSQTNEMLTYAIERLDKATDEAVIQTRGMLMQQYLLGETDTWDATKDIKIWEQWKELKELEDEAKDVEPKEQSDTAGQVSKDNTDADPLKSPIV
ncbi:hypothetical protein LWI29_001975 [Acer saccharum]|uniref:Uncharacterized protein n=1 Tax=Acer saccharum TaxID=4024 RepID=A0AA39RG93_ACESA|nr:hypothetical protein LWI29_001975 [Acer saccharum]